MTRKILFSFIFLLMPVITAMAAVGDTFKVETDGIPLWYRVISEDECQVGAEINTGDEYGYPTALGKDDYEQYTGPITIPETVTYQNHSYKVTKIGYEAFEYAMNVSYKLPQSITTIGGCAFYHIDYIETINIPKSYKNFEIADGYYPFESSAIQKVTMQCDENSFNYDLFNNTQSGPEDWVWDNDDPTKIGDNKFKGDTELKGTYTVQDGVVTIGVAAFQNCVNITKIIIPSSVVSIGEYAFSGCTSLEEVDFNADVTSIPTNCFNNCPKLKTFTVKDKKITSVGYGAFQNCTELSDISWLGKLTSIGNYAFAGTSVKEFIWPESLTTINAAFNGSKIEKITIPTTVTTIGQDAFQNCKNLTQISLSEGITIQDGAFRGCTGLTDLTIPKNAVLTATDGRKSDSGTTGQPIKGGQFDGCTGLKSLTISEGVTSLPRWAFYGCTGLTEVVLPSTIKSMDEGTFGSCTGLKVFDALKAKDYKPTEAYRKWTSGITSTYSSPFESIGESTLIYLAQAGTREAEIPNTIVADENGNLVCKSFIYDPSVNTEIPYAFTAQAFTVKNRTLTAGTSTTLALPVSIPEDGNPSGKLYAISESQDNANSVDFTEVKNTEAGTAYILKPTAATFTATNVSVPATTTETAAAKRFAPAATAAGLYGVKESGTVEGTVYVFDGTNFVKKENPTLTATEAYLVPSSSEAPESLAVVLNNAPVYGEGEDVTIGETGWSTFCSSINVDFSSWWNESTNTGVKAYYIPNLDGSTIYMVRVFNIKAGEGVVLVSYDGKDDEGNLIINTEPTTVKVVKKEGLPADAGGNKLVGLLEDTNLQPQTTDGTETYINFYLSKPDRTSEVGFYKVPDGGRTITAGKAYLPIAKERVDSWASEASSAKLSINIIDDPETTGIAEINNEESGAKNQKVYDLSGRYVGNSIKGLKSGLYIQNGRKIVVK